jgi:hypothetical protein
MEHGACSEQELVYWIGSAKRGSGGICGVNWQQGEGKKKRKKKKRNKVDLMTSRRGTSILENQIT